jgi:hypothetical protein
MNIKSFMRPARVKVKQPCFGITDLETLSSAIEILNELVKNDVCEQETYPYKKYLRTKWWKLRRYLYMEYHANVCQICKKHFAASYLQLHHSSYANLRTEAVGDLVLVCKKCHFKLEIEKNP